MEFHDKEVYFSEYCKKCVWKKLKECDEPCDRCLEEPIQQDSHKPALFKEGNKNEK